MTITCPKCQHVADDTDEYGSPVTSCPQCGIIYARYNPNAREDAKSRLKEAKKNKPKSDDAEAKPPLKEQLSKPVIKRLIIATVTICFIYVLSWVGYGFYQEKKQKEEIARKTAEIKEHVAHILKDPASAQFEKFLLTEIGGACGYVNAKNSMGGYVGFKGFVVEPDNGNVVFERDDEDENIPFMIDADSFCRNFFFDHNQYQSAQEEKLKKAKERATRLEEMEKERQKAGEEIDRAIERIRTGG